MKLVWQAEEVLRAVRGQYLHEQSWSAFGVAIDSRSVQKDDIFIALKGPSHDAHNFVGQAFAAGAAAAIVQQTPSQVPSDAPLIFVDDTFTALQDLGRVGRRRAKAKILAVTGSVGKTSSKEQLRLMLESVGGTYANEGSLNNHWGVPLSLSRLPADALYGIFEIGMNHAGELGPLSREVQPHVSLITNVEAVHLEYFSSVEAIAEAKAEIFLGSDPDGIAVLNRDNPHFARLLAAARTQGLKHALSFGRDPKSDARLINCKTDIHGSLVKAVVLGQPVEYHIGSPGEHIAFNSLGTLLAAAAAGADIATCAEALSNFSPPKGRGTQQTINIGAGESFTIIDESYNASPVATRAAIQVLASSPIGSGGRRIAILGDMRELGATSARLHAELAQSLVEAKIDLVHCCGEMMAYLYNSLPPAMRGKHTLNSTELAPLVADDVMSGDVIVVKGSKSVKMNLVVDMLKKMENKSNGQNKLAC